MTCPLQSRDRPSMNFGGDHSAPGHGEISPRCVPEGASDEKKASSWQHIACMHSNTANFGKICVACIQKAPQSAVGEYTARTSCHQGCFRRPKPPNHARRTNLAALRWPCPCVGAPARATASQDRLSTAWPCPGGAYPPAPRQYLPLAVTPPCSSNSTKHVQLGLVAPSEEKERSTSKNQGMEEAAWVPLQAAACLRGLRHALDSLHKLAAPDEQPKPTQAASCLRRKRLPNVRPNTLRLDRPHTPQPPAVPMASVPVTAEAPQTDSRFLYRRLIVHAEWHPATKSGATK